MLAKDILYNGRMPADTKSILADHQIREIAKHGMIDPFVDTQKGKPSYGLGSFGYDMRLGKRFMVPIGGLNAMLDPLRFPVDHFREFEETEALEIAPHSQILAESVERFDMPDDVMAVCWGKSTYARCFSGDTKVALVGQLPMTFEEMAENPEDDFWGYGVSPDGNVMVVRLEAPRLIAQDNLVEVLLDNEEVIQCTPDHEFVMRNGELKRADQLACDDSLMPLYRTVCREREVTYNNKLGFLEATYRLSDEWNLRHGVYDKSAGDHRHHIDHDMGNDRPPNINRMPSREHIQHHNDLYYGGEDFDPEEHGEKIHQAFIRLMEDDEWCERLSDANSKKAREFWSSSEYEDAREKILHRLRNPSPETRDRMSEGQLRRYQRPGEREARSKTSKDMWANASESRRQQQAEIARSINIRDDIDADAVRDALETAGTIRGAARLLGCSRGVFRRFKDVMEDYLGRPYNHKVVSVRKLSGRHDVYCLTSPETGNFALESGVFVKNCGLLINITPMESGWNGVLTLELANLAPLPIRLYVGQGIAQAVFFRGAEPLRTYETKESGGIYQDQTGVMLPQ